MGHLSPAWEKLIPISPFSLFPQVPAASSPFPCDFPVSFTQFIFTTAHGLRSHMQNNPVSIHFQSTLKPGFASSHNDQFRGGVSHRSVALAYQGHWYANKTHLRAADAEILRSHHGASSQPSLAAELCYRRFSVWLFLLGNCRFTTASTSPALSLTFPMPPGPHLSNFLCHQGTIFTHLFLQETFPFFSHFFQAKILNNDTMWRHYCNPLAKHLCILFACYFTIASPPPKFIILF